MSISIHRALAALAAIALLVVPAQGQQKKQVKQPFGITKLTPFSPVGNTQHLPRGQGAAKPPRKTLEIVPPRISGSVPVHRQPVLVPVKAAPPPSSGGFSPNYRLTPKQRPIEAGHLPAGNPHIAKRVHDSQLRIDPAVRQLKSVSPGKSFNGAHSLGQEARSNGPFGNAAPTVGSRGFAADEQQTPRERQNSVWQDTLRRALDPNVTNLHIDQRGGVSRLLPDGSGWERRSWNSHGDFVQESTQYRTDPNGQNSVTHSTVVYDEQGQSHRSSKTTPIDGPINSWSHQGGSEPIRNDGWSSGDRKGEPAATHAVTATFNGQIVTAGGSASSPSNGNSGNGGTSGHKGDDKGPRPQSDQPEKDIGAVGGPKKESSSAGAEGTDGLGVAGGAGRPLPRRQERGESRRNGPPISVVQPSPDNNQFGSGHRARKIEAPEFRRGGYIPTSPQTPHGQDLAAQPFEQGTGRQGLRVDSRPYAERLHDAVVNPYER